jgi:Tol biopolymer transport system component
VLSEKAKGNTMNLPRLSRLSFIIAPFILASVLLQPNLATTALGQSSDSKIAFVAFTQDPQTGSTIPVVSSMNPDGSNVNQLAPGQNPQLSPDGSMIAFWNTNSDGMGVDVFVINSDGSNLRRLTTDRQSHHPVWYPDGSKIAFVFDSNVNGVSSSEIDLMSVDGSGRVALTDPTGLARSPSWSPDGKLLAFLRGGGSAPWAWVLAVQTLSGQFVQSSSCGSVDTSPASWFPDSAHYAYTCYGPTSIGNNTYIASLAASPTQLPYFSASAPTVSPDGNRMAFITTAVDVCCQGSLAIIDASGANPKTVPLGDFNDQLSWSPDSLHIAIGRDRPNISEIWTIDADGSNLQQIPTNVSANDPHWSRDVPNVPPTPTLTETPMPTSTPTPTPTPTSPPRKVVVFLQGVCTSINKGTSSVDIDSSFNDLQNMLLTPEYGYHDTDFLLYSYKGGYVDANGAWHHNAYSINDPIKQDFRTTSLNALHDNLLMPYYRVHPNTTFVLVGHSLGGMVAMEEIVTKVSSPGYLRGLLSTVITVDSPLHGVNEYYAIFGSLLKASAIQVKPCLYNGQVSTTLMNFHRNEPTRTNTLQQAVAHAKQQGVVVATVGNTRDCLWDPRNCQIPIAGDISTQWIYQSDALVGEFNVPQPCVYASLDCLAGTHNVVLSNTYAPLELKEIAELIGRQN